MIYTDTRDSSVKTDFKNAVLSGMNSKTGGLFIPTSFPKLSDEILKRAAPPSFRELAFEMAKPYVEGEIPDADLNAIIADCPSYRWAYRGSRGASPFRSTPVPNRQKRQRGAF